VEPITTEWRKGIYVSIIHIHNKIKSKATPRKPSYMEKKIDKGVG